jgi:hypothetical protein
MSTNIAQQFATLVDGTNYEEAAKLLADDCNYQYSEGKYQGRDNIINIYRQNHEQSKKIFDEIVYSSNVEETADGIYKIEFFDKIRKKHAWHEYKCCQIFTVADGLITDIEHHEYPGETELLRAFYRNLQA